MVTFGAHYYTNFVSRCLRLGFKVENVEKIGLQFNGNVLI